jgi:hypothetical protein
VSYYLRQAGRGGERGGGSISGYDGIGPIYSSTLYKKRGNGLGSFLGGLFQYVKPILWSSAKDLGRATINKLGREALCTGGLNPGRYS